MPRLSNTHRLEVNPKVVVKKLVFSRDELSRCNGKNGAPAFIAYKERVYDVSDSFLWRHGTHEVVHDAGLDLTEAMDQAPHFADVLDGFPIVGTLANRGER